MPSMYRLHVIANTVCLGLALLVLPGLNGCNSSARCRSGITSPYPLERVRSAVRCAEAGDARAVDLLIEMLDDQDQGVRMYSILALQKLCGEDYEYEYYAPDSERSAAIARWRQARQRGEVSVQPAGGLSAQSSSTETEKNHD